jgi:hypothetical protein
MPCSEVNVDLRLLDAAARYLFDDEAPVRLSPWYQPLCDPFLQFSTPTVLNLCGTRTMNTEVTGDLHRLTNTVIWPHLLRDRFPVLIFDLNSCEKRGAWII